MSNQQHPITPPPELVQQWQKQAPPPAPGVERITHIATQAARWGADQELEACVEWCADESIVLAQELQEARRPKPLSLKEQALTKINAILSDPRKSTLKDEIEALELSRRALERLKELEKGNE